MVVVLNLCKSKVNRTQVNLIQNRAEKQTNRNLSIKGDHNMLNEVNRKTGVELFSSIRKIAYYNQHG